MKILFLHGWTSKPGGVKPTFLAQHGHTVLNPALPDGIRTVMFVCGDDETAKSVVMQLAADIGFDAVDAGKLQQARFLEPWAMLWISLLTEAWGGMSDSHCCVVASRA